MGDSMPEILLLFACLKCDRYQPLSKLLATLVLRILEPHKMLQGLVCPPLFIYKQISNSTLHLWWFHWKPATFCWGENRQIELQISKFRKGKVMKKGLSLGLGFMKTYLFWQMFLKGRFMFMLLTVWSLLWGVKSMLTPHWLRIGFLPKFCVSSSPSAHPFTFFLLVVADFSFCRSQRVFHFHFSVLTETTSFRNQGAPSFKTWRE